MSVLKLISLCLLLSIGSFEGKFSLYPLANDYFDIIYEIKNFSDKTKLHTNQEESLFLRVYCKDHNVVSVSLTPRLEFT